MKQMEISLIIISVLVGANSFAQQNISAVKQKQSTMRQLTIEPGIGIHTNFGTDLLISNLV